MNISVAVGGQLAIIPIPGLTKKVYLETRRLLERALSSPKVKNRDAITEAFLFARSCSPQANPSDLWHHVVYRTYCEIYTRYKPQDPKQSWVRASGDALELAIEAIYTPVLSTHGIRIKALLSGSEKLRALSAMGLHTSVGSAKLDVGLYIGTPESPVIFGGVHVKASLAERISDDIPCSRAMRQLGFFSPLWTLDVKSFPPPFGNLVNRGELGSPNQPSDKRRYIEEHGDFDNCYSANTRTIPSLAATKSGKFIVTLSLSKQPDQFVADVIKAAGRAMRRTNPA